MHTLQSQIHEVSISQYGPITYSPHLSSVLFNMSVCVSGCVWVSICVGECMCGWMYVWVSACESECDCVLRAGVSECVSVNKGELNCLKSLTIVDENFRPLSRLSNYFAQKERLESFDKRRTGNLWARLSASDRLISDNSRQHHASLLSCFAQPTDGLKRWSFHQKSLILGNYQWRWQSKSLQKFSLCKSIMQNKVSHF